MDPRVGIPRWAADAMTGSDGRRDVPHDLATVYGTAQGVAVPLTNGGVTLVDAEDAERVRMHKWHGARRHPDTPLYARTNMDGRKVLLHRWLLGAPREVDVDHNDRDPMNNRRGNLRVATRAQNGMNRAARTRGTSRYKGVTRLSRRHGQYVSFQVDLRGPGRRVRLGTFRDEQDAACVADLGMALWHDPAFRRDNGVADADLERCRRWWGWIVARTVRTAA